MSYLVIARKWRPQRFEEIVGQDFVSKTLKNAISSGRVAHAFLFSGARGVGKTSTARILAKALNCVEGPTTTPCNVCDNCIEISDGRAIDVFEIDGASNRGIDDIRELRENIKYAPSKSKNKIYIVDEVHMLTKEAFNALLKTLEEPPPHVVFIFATTEPHKIPITILSRCQRYDFKKITLKDIFGHLKYILEKEGIKISDSSVMQIAKSANGSMRDGQSILDQAISYGGDDISDDEVNNILGVIDSSLIYALVSAVIEKDASGVLKVIAKIHDYGYDINQFCFNILEAFRDIIAFKVSDDPQEVIELSDGELKEIESFAAATEVKELLLMHNILYKAEEEITKSLNPKMLLEMAVLKMINRFPVLPLQALYKKINALEKKILSGSGNVISLSNSLPQKSAPKSVAGVSEASGAVEKQIKKDVTPLPETRPTLVPAEEDTAPVTADAADLLSHIKKNDMVLYSHINSLEKFDVSGDEIVLSAVEGFVFLDYFRSDAVQEKLKRLSHDYYQRNLTITIKTVEKKSKKELYKNRIRTKRERLLDGEHSDPLFSKARELFEGEIIDFKSF